MTVHTYKWGRFPELTSVQRVFPNPFPSAGDITPRSEWTSSSTASHSGGSNGEVPSYWEAAVLAVADGFETSESVMGVRCGESVSTAVDEGLGELSFSAKGVDGCVEVPDLIFVLAKASDVGGKTPVPKLVGSLREMGEVGGATLKEAEEPWA